MRNMISRGSAEKGGFADFSGNCLVFFLRDRCFRGRKYFWTHQGVFIKWFSYFFGWSQSADFPDFQALFIITFCTLSISILLKH